MYRNAAANGEWGAGSFTGTEVGVVGVEASRDRDNPDCNKSDVAAVHVRAAAVVIVVVGAGVARADPAIAACLAGLSGGLGVVAPRAKLFRRGGRCFSKPRSVDAERGPTRGDAGAEFSPPGLTTVTAAAKVAAAVEADGLSVGDRGGDKGRRSPWLLRAAAEMTAARSSGDPGGGLVGNFVGARGSVLGDAATDVGVGGDDNEDGVDGQDPTVACDGVHGVA